MLTLCAQFTVGPRNIVVIVNTQQNVLQLSQFIYLLSVNFICLCALVDLFRIFLTERCIQSTHRFLCQWLPSIVDNEMGRSSRHKPKPWNKNQTRKKWNKEKRDQINPVLMLFNWILIHKHNAECAIFHDTTFARTIWVTTIVMHHQFPYWSAYVL